MSLSSTFRAGLAQPRDDGPDLEQRLDELWASVRGAWPGVALDPDRFLPYLAARLPDGGTSVEALGRMVAADLYLACGCVQGDAAALAAFETHLMKDVSAIVGRMTAAVAALDDAKQNIRARLLVRDGERRPGIADYAGHGPLRTWLKVTVARELYKVLGRGRREVQADTGELADLPVADDDPEIAHLKRLYQQEFKDAFEAALQALGRRERTLLRYHYVERLTIDEIGVLQRVHRATAARRLAEVRDGLLAATRERMVARLRLKGDGELTSILRLIESQLHASVIRVLGSPRRS